MISPRIRPSSRSRIPTGIPNILQGLGKTPRGMHDFAKDSSKQSLTNTPRNLQYPTSTLQDSPKQSPNIDPRNQPRAPKGLARFPEAIVQECPKESAQTPEGLCTIFPRAPRISQISFEHLHESDALKDSSRQSPQNSPNIFKKTTGTLHDILK